MVSWISLYLLYWYKWSKGERLSSVKVSTQSVVSLSSNNNTSKTKRKSRRASIIIVVLQITTSDFSSLVIIPRSCSFKEVKTATANCVARFRSALVINVAKGPSKRRRISSDAFTEGHGKTSELKTKVIFKKVSQKLCNVVTCIFTCQFSNKYFFEDS